MLKNLSSRDPRCRKWLPNKWPGRSCAPARCDASRDEGNFYVGIHRRRIRRSSGRKPRAWNNTSAEAVRVGFSSAEDPRSAGSPKPALIAVKGFKVLNAAQKRPQLNKSQSDPTRAQRLPRASTKHAARRTVRARDYPAEPSRSH